MPKDLVIGGVVMRTAQDVLDNYTPESERVPSEVWHTVRPLAVRAVSKSTYRALHIAPGEGRCSAAG